MPSRTRPAIQNLLYPEAAWLFLPLWPQHPHLRRCIPAVSGTHPTLLRLISSLDPSGSRFRGRFSKSLFVQSDGSGERANTAELVLFDKRTFETFQRVFVNRLTGADKGTSSTAAPGLTTNYRRAVPSICLRKQPVFVDEF